MERFDILDLKNIARLIKWHGKLFRKYSAYLKQRAFSMVHLSNAAYQFQYCETLCHSVVLMCTNKAEEATFLEETA
jgi:hypothetical protein